MGQLSVRQMQRLPIEQLLKLMPCEVTHYNEVVAELRLARSSGGDGQPAGLQKRNENLRISVDLTVKNDGHLRQMLQEALSKFSDSG